MGLIQTELPKRQGTLPARFTSTSKRSAIYFLRLYEGWIVSEWEAFQVELALGVSLRTWPEGWWSFNWTSILGGAACVLPCWSLSSPMQSSGRFYRDQRRRQLDLMAQLRARMNTRRQSREEDAIYIYTMERSCDAIAQGELSNLGLDRGVMVEVLVQRVASLLKQ